MSNPHKFNKQHAAQAKKFFCGRTAGKFKFSTSVSTDGKTTVKAEGYPIVWNVLSSDRGGYKVKLAPNSANFESTVMSFWNHNTDLPLASTANKTLTIGKPDDIGIPIAIQFDADTSIGKDVAKWVQTGICNGMSFDMANGFEEYSESEEGDDYIITVTKFTASEVSPTAIPSFSDTTLALVDDEQKPEPEMNASQSDSSDPDANDKAIAAAQVQLSKLKLEHFQAT